MKRFYFTGILCLTFFNQIYGQSPGGVDGAYVWFETENTTENYRSNFKWKDKGIEKIPLFRNGSVEYNYGNRNYFNFNPALFFYNTLNEPYFTIEDTNMSQLTSIGVFIPRTRFNYNEVLYTIEGRKNEHVTVTTDVIDQDIESPKESLDYGSDIGKDLRYQEGDQEGSIQKYREQSMRVLTYMLANQPYHYSIWGNPTSTRFEFGNQTDGSTTTQRTSYSFEGYIPEFIVYDRILTPLERYKVETYLSIKYGNTLDKSYIGSCGKLLWDFDESPNYNHRITGLYRDDVSDLKQTMSTTSHQETYESHVIGYSSYWNNNPETKKSSAFRLLTISDTLLLDNEYAIWGDNDTSLRTIEGDGVAGMRMMERHWEIRTNYTRKNASVELSTYGSNAQEFYSQRENAYLIIDRSGTGDFEGELVEYYETSGYDSQRYKILFENIAWDTDGNGKDVFTFAYKESDLVATVEGKDPDCITKKGSMVLDILEGDPYYYYTLKKETESIISDSLFYKKNQRIDSLNPGTYTLSLLNYSIEELHEVYTLWYNGAVYDETTQSFKANPDFDSSNPFYGKISYNRPENYAQIRFKANKEETFIGFTTGVNFYDMNTINYRWEIDPLTDEITILERGEEVYRKPFIESGKYGIDIIRNHVNYTLDGQVVYSSTITPSGYYYLVMGTKREGEIKEVEYAGMKSNLVEETIILEEPDCEPEKPDPETNPDKMEVYPVPSRAGEEFNIKVDLKNKGTIMVLIYDMKGRLMSQEYYNAPLSNHLIKAKIEEIGLYIIKVLSKEGEFTKKITIY